MSYQLSKFIIKITLNKYKISDLVGNTKEGIVGMTGKFRADFVQCIFCTYGFVSVLQYLKKSLLTKIYKKDVFEPNYQLNF